MEQLSGQDAMFVYFETSRTPFHLGGFATYDPSTAPGGRVGFDDILAHTAARLPLLPILRRRLVRLPLDIDRPYWIDDPYFDLEYHVRGIALPRPGNWHQLCAQAARILSRPLDPTKPLWEIYFVEGLEDIADTPPGSFGIITKLHHAAVDGVAGLELSSVLHTQSPDPVKTTPSDDAWEPEHQPTTMDLMARAVRNYVSQPGRLAGAVSHTVKALARLPGSLQSGELHRERRHIPRTRFNGPVDSHRVVDACDFELAEIRRIKEAVPGATVNDVVLAVVSGALRQYLDAKGELPAEPLVGLIPVSVRTPDQRKGGGNQVTMMRVSLGDPRGRSARTARRHPHLHRAGQNAVSSARGKDSPRVFGVHARWPFRHVGSGPLVLGPRRSRATSGPDVEHANHQHPWAAVSHVPRRCPYAAVLWNATRLGRKRPDTSHLQLLRLGHRHGIFIPQGAPRHRRLHRGHEVGLRRTREGRALSAPGPGVLDRR